MALFVNAENDVWMDGVQVAGQQLRLQQAGQFLTTAGATGTTGVAGRPGVRDAAGSPLLVQASSGMAITVNAGTAWVQGTASATAGMYTACLDTTGTITVAASDPTNPRIDNVIAQITDVGTSSSTTRITLQTGTPAGSPVAPTLPANSLLLATVSVAALATTIVGGNITDKRAFTTGLGGIVKMDTSGGITGPAGQFAYDSATGRVKVSDGSGNARAPKVAPFGSAFYTSGGATTLISSSPQTLISVSVTFDSPSSVYVTGGWRGISENPATVADGLLFQLLFDGSSMVGGTGFCQYCQPFANTASAGGGSFHGAPGGIPAAGSHTIALVVTTSVLSAFTVDSYYLIVEAAAP